jgi:L,D-transpeptidase catalytic domain
MRRFWLIAAALAAGLTATAAQARVEIEIDKSTQRMAVIVDGVQRHSWAVSTGRAGYATPDGSYTPFRLEVDHFSKEWDDAPMPHSIFFTREGHAIHGSFETKKLGMPASAGCVRLAPPNAAVLFALVKEHGLANTRVMIDGIEPPSAPATARRGGARDPQLAPEADTSGVRVWPSEPAVRRDLDPYARGRRQYYDERWPSPLYVQPYAPPRAYPYVGGYRYGY